LKERVSCPIRAHKHTGQTCPERMCAGRGRHSKPPASPGCPPLR
jgi:hypothetical protein